MRVGKVGAPPQPVQVLEAVEVRADALSFLFGAHFQDRVCEGDRVMIERDHLVAVDEALRDEEGPGCLAEILCRLFPRVVLAVARQFEHDHRLAVRRQVGASVLRLVQTGKRNVAGGKVQRGVGGESGAVESQHGKPEVPKANRRAEIPDRLGRRGSQQTQHKCQRQRADHRPHIDRFAVVYGDLLEAGAIVGNFRDSGSGADALAAQGVGGGLRDLTVAVLRVVEGAVEVAGLLLRTAKRFKEKRFEVQAFEPVAGHPRREAIGGRPPQFLGVVEKEEGGECGPVALMGHLPEVVGVVRDAGNGELLP